jgi:exosortase/archaeosortase family protein
MTPSRRDDRWRPRAAWRPIVAFLVLAAAFNGAWQAAAGTGLERFVIDTVTVGGAARIVERLSPEAHPRAAGRRLAIDGASVNVLNGCDGTEVWTLLAAAILVCPLSLGARVIGVILGTGLVFALNQCRLIALLYTLRDHRSWFVQVHGVIGPLVLIAATLGFVALLLRWDARGG